MDICVGSELSQPVNTSHDTTSQSQPDSGRISAYYSLVFPNFTFYIQTLDVTIGRRTVPSEGSPSSSTTQADHSGQVDVDLGTLKSVSRLHARIEYDAEQDRFVLVVIGRNGAWVDGVWAGSGSRAPLGERSQIQIASRTFEFVLPPPAPPEDTPSPSSLSSANRHRSPSLDITSISPPSSLPSHSPAPLAKPPPPTSTRPPSKKRKKGDGDGPIINPIPPQLPPKPPHTYAQLIYKALKGIGQKATLQEICAWIMNAFTYYKYADKAWMSAIRHNVSSVRAFKKLERSSGDRGKGFFWCLDDSVEHNFEALEIKLEPSSSGGKDGSMASKKPSARKAQKTPSVPTAQTFTARAISGPATNAQNLTTAAAVSPKPTGTTGVFAYYQNPYAALAQWTPTQQQPTQAAAAQRSAKTSTTPSPVAQLPPSSHLSTSAGVAALHSRSYANPRTASNPSQTPRASTSAISATPPTISKASATPASGASNISISIVLGAIPPSHPEYTPGQPNNSKAEGYMVFDGRTLILDPIVFGNLTKETLSDYERMGTQEAVKLLSKQAARARRAKQAGRSRGRGRGAGSGGTASERKDRPVKQPRQSLSGSASTNASVHINRQPVLKTGGSHTVLSLGPPGAPLPPITSIQRSNDESAQVVIVDSDDEMPAAKRQKTDGPEGMMTS